MSLDILSKNRALAIQAAEILTACSQDLERVILFGFNARGTPTQESDIDLLITFNDLPPII